MGDIYIGNSGVARKAEKVYIGVNDTARQVQKIYLGVNGVAREVYTAYNPPSYADISISNVYVSNETMTHIGAQLPMSDFATALANGYSKFHVTITGTVDALSKEKLYIGLSKNGGDVGGISTSQSGYGVMVDAGSYHTQSQGFLSKTMTFTIDVADLISQVGAEGYIQAGYRGNAYSSSYTPDITCSGSLTNMYFSEE